MKHKHLRCIFPAFAFSFIVISVNATASEVTYEETDVEIPGEATQEGEPTTPGHYNTVEIMLADGKSLYVAMKDLQIEIVDGELRCYGNDTVLSVPVADVKKIGHLFGRIGIEIPDESLSPEIPEEPGISTGVEELDSTAGKELRIRIGDGVAYVSGLDPAETMRLYSVDGRLLGAYGGSREQIVDLPVSRGEIVIFSISRHNIKILNR